jgi:hypothetical protein
MVMPMMNLTDCVMPTGSPTARQTTTGFATVIETRTG